MKFAKRTETLPPYLFAEIDKKKQAAIEKGVDIINMGIGDPDKATFSHIVDEMVLAVKDPSTHNYPPYQGTKDFRVAAVKWFEKRFGEKFDPDKECVSTIGSKEAIHNLILAVIDQGDICLTPDPAYPVYKTSTLLCGGTPHIMPLYEKNNWLPDLSKIPTDVAQKANMMIICYPNNPTGAIAPIEFYDEVVAYCKKYDIILMSDNAYSEVGFDGYEPPSIFNAKGARDIAIELHSLSKSYNMTGWRVGFAIGNEKIVKALGTVKTNIDSGVFKAVQRAAIAAFNTPKEVLQANVDLYRERRDAALEGLRSLGCDIKPSKGTLYVWAPIPSSFKSSGEFASTLLDKCGIVVPPGNGYGACGEGYFRIALSIDKSRIKEAFERMKKEGILYSKATVSA